MLRDRLRLWLANRRYRELGLPRATAIIKAPRLPPEPAELMPLEHQDLVDEALRRCAPNERRS